MENVMDELYKIFGDKHIEYGYEDDMADRIKERWERLESSLPPEHKNLSKEIQGWERALREKQCKNSFTNGFKLGIKLFTEIPQDLPF